MPRILSQSIVGALALFFTMSTDIPAADNPAAPVRERISFNQGWRFQKDDPAGTGDTLSYSKLKPFLITASESFQKGPANAQKPDGNPGGDVSFVQSDFDDSAWRKLDLPHDFGIEGPFAQEHPGETGKLPWWGVAWYRKSFDLPSSDAGRRIYLDVDGAMSFASVWCNGQFVGGWPYGYASWRVDLTPFVKPGGKNVAAIRLDNPPESSRWYPGGGIYRNVWLVKTPQIHVAHWGVKITTPEVSASEASVNVDVAIENGTASETALTARTEIYEIRPDGQRSTAPVASAVGSGQIAARGVIVNKLKIRNPALWSIESPRLYVARASILSGQKVIDSTETMFGVRTIKFTADKGFLLNGKRVPLNGVCNHHDLGALGAAVNTRALERQLEILKTMGCNAIRTSHNPPAPELLDLCDRMGLVVMDEFSDTWKAAKKPNGYALLFDDWAEKDLRTMIRRDRNHPCVILWSTGNEIGEQGGPKGHEISRQLTAIVHDEDAGRPVAAGCNFPQAGYNGFQKTVDVFGYNYKPHEYKKFREANPGIPLVGSETSSCISSRGEYFFPVSGNKDDGKSDFQMSSYDLYAPSWATTPDTEFAGQDEHPFVAGEFVWTGFDYLGEPTPYNADSTNLLNYHTPEAKAAAEKELKELGKIKVPSRSSYFGIIDLAGFPKDRYYIYQAHWRPDFPMAHILPHWNWPERVGEVTPVHVYTSGDEAELFLNGKSLGKKTKGKLEYRLRWDDVKYAPGELKVVAYKNGKRWAESVMKTTAPAAKLALTPDRATIKADGRDLSFITVAIADKNGLTVPRTKNLVKFEISGPGEIVATDNGDATDHTVFASHERKAFNGLALVIVRGKPGAGGPITVTASADGLQSGTTTVHAK
jgi:beta-galactosidase